jgi:hypothetical protein
MVDFSVAPVLAFVCGDLCLSFVIDGIHEAKRNVFSMVYPRMGDPRRQHASNSAVDCSSVFLITGRRSGLSWRSAKSPRIVHSSA